MGYRAGTDPLRFRERVKDWKELLEFERTRTTIEATPDEKWAETFTSTREETLNEVDERIDTLRKKLGLLPGDARALCPARSKPRIGEMG
jgi:hypothetical protein